MATDVIYKNVNSLISLNGAVVVAQTENAQMTENEFPNPEKWRK
jgi:hypothetical protein